MRKLLAFGLILAAFAAAPFAQTATPKPAAAAPAAQSSAASFTGKWDGTLTMQRQDGTESTQPAQFNLTQAGKVVTGTAGPPDGQWKVEKGAVVAGKATFEVQQPNGPLLKFALTIVKGRLQGTMSGENNGVTRTAKIDAAKAAK